ncbi:MAG: KEOPS complex kinase/ATPase Bud32 [Candidatus Diapherotrites archaeon]
MKEIGRGAEARLLLENYQQVEVVEKRREAKPYRNPKLDLRIRSARTKAEAGILQRARSIGVRTPRVLKVELENSGLFLEYLKGKRMKESFQAWMAGELGKNIALLHSNGIIHGDLTTSNVIVRGKKLALIDFSLGYYAKDVEDFATDLLGLQKTFQATHPGKEKEWKQLLRAYEKGFAKGKTVFGHMKEIEARARYS